jgi:hypothetical protein
MQTFAINSEVVMNANFANFRAVYDELSDEVTRARHAFLPDHLRNWLATIDETPDVSRIVEQLQSGLDFPTWFQQCEQTKKLAWPEQREKRLGMQLLLFRAAAQGKPDIGILGVHFLHAGRDVNVNASAFVEQVFAPMARDLRRYLEQQIGSVAIAPASDRVVRLDHNSAAYTDAMQALETLERVLKEANDFPSLEEKEQQVAEVSATRRLLQSVRVRIAPVVSLAGPPLTYLAKKFIDTGIGKAAGAAIDKLIALFGHIF